MPLTPSSLVLASTSAYRKALLERLGLPFQTRPSHLDETPLADENTAGLACRLAHAKAYHVWQQDPGAAVIGSDQAADLAGRKLGKPGTVEAAVTQLQACSGQVVTFYTAVCVLGPDGFRRDHLDVTEVVFRELSEAEIRRYIAADQPLDCAGAFKAEALGISLFSAIRNQDPTALTGLPLIWVSQCLRELGLPTP